MKIEAKTRLTATDSVGQATNALKKLCQQEGLKCTRPFSPNGGRAIVRISKRKSGPRLEMAIEKALSKFGKVTVNYMSELSSTAYEGKDYDDLEITIK